MAADHLHHLVEEAEVGATFFGVDWWEGGGEAGWRAAAEGEGAESLHRSHSFAIAKTYKTKT